MMEELRAGQSIDGRFELERLIGRGGMGAVWKATQVPLGRVVALKVLRPEYSALPHLRRRFSREARAAASLNHEHIASVFDFGTDAGGHMYLAMEHVEGVQLAEIVGGGVSILEIITLARQLLSALSHAHARGVVHRDLKPENVILSGGYSSTHIGLPKIVDFGIATIASESLEARETDQDQVVGTPLYMSPEQIIGRNVDFRADLYGLGCSLFECATGTVPFFKGDLSYHHLHTKPPTPKSINPALSNRLELAILKLLEKNPDDRYQSASEVLRTYTSARQKA